MQLYVKSDLSLEDLAMQVAKTALPSYRYELREGANLGGGEYFKYELGECKILLVCNDADHTEVFVKSMQQFPHYFYVRTGPGAVLEVIYASLVALGYECEIADEL